MRLTPQTSSGNQIATFRSNFPTILKHGLISGDPAIFLFGTSEWAPTQEA